MKKAARAGLITLCGVLAIAAITLFYLSSQDNGAPYNEGVRTLNQIQSLDNAWSLEATKVRSNPQADFDELAAITPQINALKSELNQVVLTTRDIPDRFANSVSAYLSSLESKEEQIERFKTGYAVIRNSERYLPLSANTVIEAARQEGEINLAGDLGEVVEGINGYLRTPTESEQSRLQLFLDELTERSVDFPSGLSSAVANFLSHAQVLLDNTLPTAEILEAATSNKNFALAQQLTEGFRAMAAEVDRKAKLFEYGAIGSLVALVLFSLLLAFKGQSAGTGGFAFANQQSGEDGELLSLAGAKAGSDISYQVFAGMIGDDLVGALGRLKLDARALKTYSSEIDDTVKRIQQTILNIENGEQSGETALLSLKTDMETRNQLIEPDKMNEFIDSVQHSYGHLFRIAGQLTEFSGKEDDSKHTWVSINDLVRELMLPVTYNNDATVDIRLGDVPHIFGSPGELKHLMKAIVDNAVTAVKEAKSDEPSISVLTQSIDGQICVTITDNGVGIEPERRKALTQLFKPDAEGKLDLGIPSANYLARRYGGKLLLNSVPEKGTAVRIMLPESRKAA